MSQIYLELIEDSIPEVCIKDAVKMDGIKFKVTPELSREFQEEFLKNGGCWRSGCSKILYTESEYLFITNKRLDYTSSSSAFVDNANKQIYLILSKQQETSMNNKESHFHAELMLEYAKDALKSKTPWENWQYSYDECNWYQLHENPDWSIITDYRRKPIKIMI